MASWNTFIEGDNLDVLATLDRGSVDLVYIDPPYNTGNDFAYRDSLLLARRLGGDDAAAAGGGAGGAPPRAARSS